MPSSPEVSEPSMGLDWVAYDRWNAALIDVVYTPDAADTAVYLDMEERVLGQAATRLDLDASAAASSLVVAVRSTLEPPETRGGAFRGHLVRLRRWSKSVGVDPPPVVALLGVLCLAAEEMRAGEGFAANNYYDRLMPLLGVEDPGAKERVIRSYRQCSQELWESLNAWLDDLKGERGLPTAYSYTHRHIGRPLSQALIRATDRDKLRDFFLESGFAPHARVSPLDMEPLLTEWLGRTPPVASHGLRLLWRRPAAKDRIVETACYLLESWEPAGDALPRGVDGVTRSGNIRLLALLGTFPTPSLEIAITGPGLGSEILTIPGQAEAPHLTPEPLPGARWRVMDESIDDASLLSGHMVLVDQTGFTFERRPRRVVPLVRDHITKCFVEVERLPLGEDSILLCHESVETTARRALGLVARPGYKVWNRELVGVPEGWYVFSGVQILAGLSGTDALTGRPWLDDLNVLQPLATSQMVLDGGLQLPGRIRRWSSLVPPELRITTDEEDALSISIEQVRGLGGPSEGGVIEAQGPIAIIDLSDCRLGDGDYEIEVAKWAGGRKRRIHQTRLRLRSADTTNPLEPETPPLSHDLPLSPLNVLTALRFSVPGIRGPAISGPVEIEGGLLEEVPEEPPLWWSRRLSPNPESEPVVYRVIVESADLVDCFHSGEHVIVLPTWYGEQSSGSIVGECRNCGLTKRYPPRGRQRRSSSGIQERPTFDFSSIPIVSHAALSVDHVFDAMAHDRFGTQSGFEQVAFQVDASRVFQDQFLRDLEVEGHIEVHRDPLTLRELDWEVVESALVEVCDGSYVLVGARSVSLMSSLRAHVSRVGAVMRTEARDRMISRVAIEPASEELVTEIWVGMSEEGHSVDVVTQAARRMIGLLPPLSSLGRELPSLPMPHYSSVQRWDAAVAQWGGVGDASQPGAYRLLGATTMYGTRSRDDVANGRIRIGDARSVKHLAGLELGETLMGYDKRRGILYVPLGADLPGLYGRAAALCSGAGPTADLGQRLLAYHDVPSDVAAAMRTLLTS